jgi:RHS repeat-associated protein
VEALGFSYDVANRLTGIDNALDGILSQDFGYDEQSRLVSMYSADAVAGYGYDADGNRITTIDTNGTRATGYSATSNRLVSSTGADPQSYGYDALGNITTLGGATAYQYDAFNRMHAAGGMAYYVNPEGQRLRKSGTAGTTYFAPDRGGALLAEYSGGSWIDYLWLNGRLIGREVNGQLEAIHGDQLGRPQVVTNASHAVVWSAQNWPFARNVTVANAVPLNLGFPGQYHNAETGLWHNGFRDYDDTLGRYVESDPIGLTGGINTYAYVGGNPISSIDPNGTNLSDALAAAKDFVQSHELQFDGGVSAFGVLMGGSLTATGGISVKGITVNLTSCGGAGGGAFASARAVAGLQKLDPCPNKNGTSTSKVLVVEGGEGVIAGVSLDASGNGGVSLGKLGVGVGSGYAAVELCTTKSFHPIDF